MKAALDRFGRLDVLFNNAGIFGPKPFLDVTEDEYDRFLSIILKGKFFIAQAAAKAMKAAGRGGAIVQTGSMWGLQAIGATPSSAYSAANGGVHALVKNLAIELAPDKIRVNAIRTRRDRDPGLQHVPDTGTGEDRFADLQCDAPSWPQRSARRRGRGASVPCLGSGKLHHRGHPSGRRRHHGRQAVIARDQVDVRHQ